MDFITYLPIVGGYDLVLVMVDRFTKMARFALLVPKPSPERKRLIGSSKTWFDYMDSQKISLLIEDHNLFLIFGGASCKLLVVLLICLPPIIHKPMDQQSRAG
jgi:hypothetical protein